MMSKMKAPKIPPEIATKSWTFLYGITIANTGIERMIDQSPLIMFDLSFNKHRQQPAFSTHLFKGVASSKLFLRVMLRIGTAATFKRG